MDDLERLFDFFLEFDALKMVSRRNLIHCGARLENSAEHSWHLAMACWAFRDFLNEDVDLLKLFKLALVHDIGEIDAGDTFLYSLHRSQCHKEERECVHRLASHPGNSIEELAGLWDEQEFGDSEEAKLLKTMDRLLPFLHNLNSEGMAWRDNGVTKSQVLAKHQFIEPKYKEMHNWILHKVDFAVKQGWIKPS